MCLIFKCFIFYVENNSLVCLLTLFLLWCQPLCALEVLVKIFYLFLKRRTYTINNRCSMPFFFSTIHVINLRLRFFFFLFKDSELKTYFWKRFNLIIKFTVASNMLKIQSFNKALENMMQLVKKGLEFEEKA
jgi:hypothetical protein